MVYSASTIRLRLQLAIASSGELSYFKLDQNVVERKLGLQCNKTRYTQ